jgi:hypothetical protein
MRKKCQMAKHLQMNQTVSVSADHFPFIVSLLRNPNPIQSDSGEKRSAVFQTLQLEVGDLLASNVGASQIFVFYGIKTRNLNPDCRNFCG